MLACYIVANLCFSGATFWKKLPQFFAWQIIKSPQFFSREVSNNMIVFSRVHLRVSSFWAFLFRRYTVFLSFGGFSQITRFIRRLQASFLLKLKGKGSMYVCRFFLFLGCLWRISSSSKVGSITCLLLI